jgi:putative flippase GtrA
MRGYAAPASLRRVGRYGCVGLAVSLCYSLAVIACVHFIDPTTASIVAFIITLPIGYLAHRGITFSDSKHDAFQPLRFALTTATSFALAVGGMYWITQIGGRDYLLGIAWTWFVIPAMNFVLYLLWVFRVERTALPAKSSQAHHFE